MANFPQAATFSAAPRMADRAEAATRAGTIPWYVWAMLAAVTSVMIGEYWDISWHISVGRDTFWTPAHMAIQLAAVIAATSASWRIFATTFGSDEVARA